MANSKRWLRSSAVLFPARLGEQGSILPGNRRNGQNLLFSFSENSFQNVALKICVLTSQFSRRDNWWRQIGLLVQLNCWPFFCPLFGDPGLFMTCKDLKGFYFSWVRERGKEWKWSWTRSCCFFSQLHTRQNAIWTQDCNDSTIRCHTNEMLFRENAICPCVASRAKPPKRRDLL